MSMNALPAELLVRVLMQMEPEELSRCDQLSKLFHGPPSLVEQALRLLDSEVGLSGIPEALPKNRANWTQALLFLAILRRGSKYKLVAAGAFRSAFVDADGALLVCGRPTVIGPTVIGSTVSGSSETINPSIPAPVAGLVGVRVHSVVASECHIIALSVDGVAFSWGRGNFGQLGHGDREDIAQPKAIRALSNVCAIDTAATHSLATTSDGALWTWGNGAYNQLGHGIRRAELLPLWLEAPAGKRMSAVATGSTHSLAACVDGGCFSWGKRSFEQDHSLYPLSVRELCGERVSSVAASEFGSCAVTSRGDIWQWGRCGHVYLKRPTPLERTLFGNHRVISVSMSTPATYSHRGDVHCFALTADGTVFSWFLLGGNTAHLERFRHVLGHRDALDAPYSQISVPRPIEALAGQRICSVLTNSDHSIAAGWAAGHAQRPQWACWSWGCNDHPNAWQALGHGEKHADTSLPRRVVGIGGTPLVTDAAHAEC